MVGRYKFYCSNGPNFGQYITARHKIDHFDWPKQGAWRRSQPQFQLRFKLTAVFLQFKLSARPQSDSTRFLKLGFNLWKFYQGLFSNEKLCMSRDLYKYYTKQAPTLVGFLKIEPSNANQ